MNKCKNLWGALAAKGLHVPSLRICRSLCRQPACTFFVRPGCRAGTLVCAMFAHTVKCSRAWSVTECKRWVSVTRIGTHGLVAELLCHRRLRSTCTDPAELAHSQVTPDFLTSTYAREAGDPFIETSDAEPAWGSTQGVVLSVMGAHAGPRLRSGHTCGSECSCAASALSCTCHDGASCAHASLNHTLTSQVWRASIPPLCALWLVLLKGQGAHLQRAPNQGLW